jgi:ribosomal protein S18 acetylase RimI-like enzyme
VNPADEVVRELPAPAPLAPWVALVREAFGTVAAEFGWTEQSVPSNAAFTTLARLEGMRQKGIRMFGLELRGTPAGFLAVEDGGGGTFYIERVAVLPRLRHAGLGRRLMGHALDVIRAAGGRKASIGVVDENAVLKRWYEAQGFRETGRKRFPHLPFTVCFMEKPL